MLTVTFTVADVSARLVQLVPNAFVVRMDRALEAQTTEYLNAPLGAALRAVPVRVWAELGRARMPAGTSLDLPTGSVVEVDREVEDPVDLDVDGLHFATGRLRVAEDGGLQLEVEQVLGLWAVPRLRWAEPVADEPSPTRPSPDAPSPSPRSQPDAVEAVRQAGTREIPYRKQGGVRWPAFSSSYYAASMRKDGERLSLSGGDEVVGQAGDGWRRWSVTEELRPKVTNVYIDDAREGTACRPCARRSRWTRRSVSRDVLGPRAGVRGARVDQSSAPRTSSSSPSRPIASWWWCPRRLSRSVSPGSTPRRRRGEMKSSRSAWPGDALRRGCRRDAGTPLAVPSGLTS